MTPVEAWQSNPIATSKIITAIRDAQDPDEAKKRKQPKPTRFENLKMQFPGYL